MKDKLANARTKNKSIVDLRLASKILATVPYNNAFYFFTDIGQYTDRCSVCLADFCNTIRTIDVRSVEFHFKRGDFAKWIRGPLGDNELANEINRVSKTIRGEELRAALHRTVEARLTKLKKLQASEEPYLGRAE